MATDESTPALVEMGAGQDDSTRGVNLDVSGTVGPDYLGQETVDVDGHPCDRPGVRNRLPENAHEEHPDLRRMDTGEELPVLLSSDMKADPCEGVQGTYTQIIEGDCARCGYDRLVHTHHTLAGEHREHCNACGAIQDSSSERGYRMPKTEEDRVEMKREAGPTLGKLTTREVVDLEPDTGWGPRVALVESRRSTSLYKGDVEDLFWMLYHNDDIDLAESIETNMRMAGRFLLARALLPDGVGLQGSDDEQDDE